MQRYFFHNLWLEIACDYLGRTSKARVTQNKAVNIFFTLILTVNIVFRYLTVHNFF